jgi:hypothetical protein
VLFVKDCILCIIPIHSLHTPQSHYTPHTPTQLHIHPPTHPPPQDLDGIQAELDALNNSCAAMGSALSGAKASTSGLLGEADRWGQWEGVLGGGWGVSVWGWPSWAGSRLPSTLACAVTALFHRTMTQPMIGLIPRGGTADSQRSYPSPPILCRC